VDSQVIREDSRFDRVERYHAATERCYHCGSSDWRLSYELEFQQVAQLVERPIEVVSTSVRPVAVVARNSSSVAKSCDTRSKI